MSTTKSYRLIFVGSNASEAVSVMNTYFQDGGGEDVILENLDQNDISAEKIAADDNEMVFQVWPKPAQETL